MNNNIFTEDFWVNQWNTQFKDVQQEKDKNTDDTFKVHKGFSTPEYWDNASLSYDTKNEEAASRRIKKTIHILKANKLIFDNCTALDIGCGTGFLSRELANNNCHVTALDFSKGMIERCKADISKDLENKIDYLQEDWNKIVLTQKKWAKKFDLVVAFMSPATSTPESFYKMMQASKNGCAIKGWAKKRKHDILDVLWEIIMKRPLNDKPQNFLFKLNMLFSMGYFPELTFDEIKWEEEISIEAEFQNQFTFFKKASDKDDAELEKIIKNYLNTIAKNGLIKKKHEGLTATAFWHIKPDMY